MKNKIFLVLFLLLDVEIKADDTFRRIGKLNNINWEEYYTLGANQATYASGIDYPSLSCVGALLSNDGILGTGTLISRNVVVTAAHLFKNSLSSPNPKNSDWEFILNSNYGNAPSNLIYKVANIIIHPGWIARLSKNNGLGDGDLLGVDLALVFLEKDVEGIYPAKLFNGVEPIGEKVVIAGFGSLVDGLSGAVSSQNERRVGGENILDRVIVEVNAPNINPDHKGGLLAIDFDSPQKNSNALGQNSSIIDYLGSGDSSSTPLSLEASTAVGDSGGPIFMMIQNAWRTIGTVSYGTSDSTYGDVTIFSRIASQHKWLEPFMGNWSQARDIGIDGWLELDWLGTFFSYSNNWNFHPIYGWFYVQSSNGESFWAWQGNHFGWWWSSLSVYPFLYSSKLESWIYVNINQSKLDELVYFDYNDMRWNVGSGND